MKPCPTCECRIPDRAHKCPHCRTPQRRVEFMPQLLLVLAAGAAAAAVLLEGCPALPLPG